MNRASSALVVLLLSALSPCSFAQKDLSAPSFKPLETSFYRVHFKINRDIKTKSVVSLSQTPTQANLDVQGILQVEVLPSDASVLPGSIRLRTWFLTLASDLSVRPRGSKSGEASMQRVPAENRFIDCTLTPAGEVDQIMGLDALASEQQQAWREWGTRFAAAFLVASEKHKRGDEWSADEPEATPSPLAELHWQKKSQYVRDEPCAPLKLTRASEFERVPNSDSCAVIVATAALVQKSSSRDSTPPDYKQHHLRTSGTATGTSDVILSISRRTGQLVRAAQNAKQQMDVSIALSDGSTQVHYDIDATATTSVELITDLPLILRPKSYE